MAVVVKAPWGDSFDRWTYEKDGFRYFFILDARCWRIWKGAKEGLSHKALAFPIEVSLRREICDLFVIILSIPQDFRVRRSSSLSSDSGSSSSGGTSVAGHSSLLGASPKSRRL